MNSRAQDTGLPIISPVGLWSPVNTGDPEVMLVKAAICLPTLSTGLVKHHLGNTIGALL